MWNHPSCYPDNIYRCIKLSGYWWTVNSLLAKINGKSRRCWSGIFAWLLNTQCSARTVKSITESVDKPSEIGHIQNDEIFMQTYLLIVFCFDSHSELPFLLSTFYLCLSAGSYVLNLAAWPWGCLQMGILTPNLLSPPYSILRLPLAVAHVFLPLLKGFSPCDVFSQSLLLGPCF